MRQQSNDYKIIVDELIYLCYNNYIIKKDKNIKEKIKWKEIFLNQK